MNILNRLLNRSQLKKYEKTIKQINEKYIEKNKDVAFSDTLDLSKEIELVKNSNKQEDEKIIEVLVLVKMACQRAFGYTLHDVQLIGALALVSKHMVEMQTGEGKTLTCAAAAVVNYALGLKTQIITANDYLAGRDSKNMSRIYSLFGITSAANVSHLSQDSKRDSYKADVMYSTAQEVGFDYLKDNLVFNIKEKVQDVSLDNVHCIVDEADFILIDEARTPLIINAGNESQDLDIYKTIQEIVSQFKESSSSFEVLKFEDREEDGHFWLDLKESSVYLGEKGYQALESMLIEYGVLSGDGKNILYMPENSWLINAAINAIKALYIFKKDVDYIVKEGQVVIIDKNTGRLSEGRSWGNGLHQAIQAKEGVEIIPENVNASSITIQVLFKRYHKLSGLSGTMREAAEEFLDIYGCPTIVIPTNKPIIRKDNTDYMYLKESVKYADLINDVVERNKRGQPVLIGTTSVEESEKVSDMLKEVGVEHSVLNAKNHFLEARIIATAGMLGSVTVATSMAGRGTDIVLGGNQEEILSFLEECLAFFNHRKNQALDLIRALHVDINIHDYVLSENSDVKTVGLNIKGTEERVKNIDNESRFLMEVENWPKEVMDYLYSSELYVLGQIKNLKANWESWSSGVKELGGLYVVGSSRNVSRRVDDQLRGRAGRQGDPGESSYYVSLEDPWMLPFQKNRAFQLSIQQLPDNQRITSKPMAKMLLRAQRAIQSQGANIRKHLYQYDAITNQSRVGFLEFRDGLLENPSEVLDNVCRYRVSELVEIACLNDFLDYLEVIGEDYNPETFLAEKDIEWLMHYVKEYQRTLVYEKKSGSFLDGSLVAEKKADEVIASIDEEAKGHLALEVLAFADKCWSSHLLNIDEAQKSAGYQSMVQKNPVYEYQRICQKSYDEMMDKITEFVLKKYVEIHIEGLHGERDETEISVSV